MKTYICKKCITFGGKSPCTLTCEDDMEPTHCPHDDSKYPNSLWELVASQSISAQDGEGRAVLEGVDYLINQVDAETISLTRRL